MGEGGLNRFYVATTLTLSSAVVYIRRERFLTHQCNISDNIKSNEYRDETTMRTRQEERTEMLKQKKTNSWTPVWGWQQEPEHQAPVDLLKSV